MPSSLELHPGDVPQKGGVGLLAQRQDHRVGGQRLESAGAWGRPASSSSITSTVNSRPVERGDRAQPVDANAFAFGLLGFLRVSRHLLAGAPVDDQRLLGAQPMSHPGGVHRGVTAAVHGHPPANSRPLAGCHAAQKRHRIDYARRVHGRDIHPLGQVRADRDEHSVEAAVAPLGVEILDPMTLHDAHTERFDAADLDVQDRLAATDRRGCRSASCRRARSPASRISTW